MIALAFGVSTAALRSVGMMASGLAAAIGASAFLVFASASIWNSRAAMENYHRVYLRSLATFELNKPEWLAEFYRCKRQGEEAERRQIELKKTEKRTEAVAVIGVLPKGGN